MATVAVVDDEQDIARLIAARLQRAGYEVSTYEDGAAALVGLTAAPTDIAVVDWMMPRLDGIALAAALRAQDATKHIRLLLVTARSDPDDLAFARTQGFEDVMTKPFTRDSLLTAVARLCDTPSLDA
ncbi:DNA-binding response OmpR family regulator [Microbacterium endophyticum]|uniref:DNA-binding response OmpR family regulator n=1 Tax=Microbacterium endophyticum TaxID=1526412 RepID=A0A7W4YMJ3_9MICO|nr:response regulator [Microbacterium endophyticum]MBB2974711.1 DNA-binding response OmpR family regulator [Microbacterium endophyticum]NIK37008.1 DNA-binding response OmpR family regulator [Microbacterium endophyticum]